MTKKDLEKVYYLKKELKMWERRLDELIADVSQDTPAADGMPFANTNNITRPTELKAIAIADHVEMIRKHKQKIAAAIREAESFIVTIEDPLIRQIVKLRCVDCMKWRDVADELDPGTTAECARQMYHRFVQTIDFDSVEIVTHVT